MNWEPYQPLAYAFVTGLGAWVAASTVGAPAKIRPLAAIATSQLRELGVITVLQCAE